MRETDRTLASVPPENVTLLAGPPFPRPRPPVVRLALALPVPCCGRSGEKNRGWKCEGSNLSYAPMAVPPGVALAFTVLAVGGAAGAGGTGSAPLSCTSSSCSISPSWAPGLSTVAICDGSMGLFAVTNCDTGTSCPSCSIMVLREVRICSSRCVVRSTISL